jgi:4-hydroxybutyrate CoA-transferase
MNESMRMGRVEVLPLPYSLAQRHLAARDDINIAFLHLSLPDEHGQCSLGLAAEFTPTAAARAERRIGILNELMPRLRGAATVPFSDLEAVVEDATPPLTILERAPHPHTATLAGHVASCIPDGATIQCGLGNVVGAVAKALGNHRKLKVHSGLITDWLMLLDAAGALDRAARHVTGVIVGSLSLYEYVRGMRHLEVLGVEHTHNPWILASIPSFASINSALEVDLLGQANLEYAKGRLVSSPGGAPDFVRGARMSSGGRAILALPAKTSDGLRSRIVARLSQPAPATLTSGDADRVVTEYGVACLADCNLDERAESLISIAAPEFRSELIDAWRNLRIEAV